MQRATRTALSIPEIDWSHHLRFVNAGGFGVVYRVPGYPKLVVKIGDIEEEEIAAQRFFAEKNMALPVLDFCDTVPLPAKLQRAMCNIHGRERRKRLGHDTYCACEDSQTRAVLLMPFAGSPLGKCNQEEIERFKFTVSELSYKQFGRFWDIVPGDVGIFEGHLVALDFGNNDRLFQ